MNTEFNWRRFLIFTPVSAALGWLTARGPDIAPQLGNLWLLIVPVLFGAFLFLFYSLPRWGKPAAVPAVVKRRLILLSIVIIGLTWFFTNKSFQQVPTWKIMLIYAMAFALVFLRGWGAGK